MSVISFINSISEKKATGGLSDKQICLAEQELKIHLATEYKELLGEFGSLFIKGEVFLGLVGPGDTVVSCTHNARMEFADFPFNVYVISNTYIDGLLITQDEDGGVYSYQPNHGSEKVAKSLFDYIRSLP